MIFQPDNPDPALFLSQITNLGQRLTNINRQKHLADFHSVFLALIYVEGIGINHHRPFVFPLGTDNLELGQVLIPDQDRTVKVGISQKRIFLSKNLCFLNLAFLGLQSILEEQQAEGKSG